MTAVLEDLRLTRKLTGDSGTYAHYVRKTGLTDAAVFGQEIEALCGFRWIPSRDPEKFPVCPTCQEIYDGLAE